MAPLETEAAVRALAADGPFKRGKELFAAKKLREVSFEGDDLEKATAICEGSSPGDCYDVSVSIDPGDSSKPTCKCTCPVGRGGPCKHAIGLLLYRLKQLQPQTEDLPTGSTGGKVKEEDEEDMETDHDVVAWVSNPVKITPNPHARRILPNWMNASVSEKPKKSRATKKQKVSEGDEGDEPQTSGRKASPRKKANAKAGDDGEGSSRRKGKAKQDDELLEEDEEPVRPAKRGTRRGKASGVEDGQVEQTARSRSRNKTVAKPASEDAKRPSRRSTRNADDDDLSIGNVDSEQEDGPRGRSKKVAKPPAEVEEEEEEVSRPRGRGRKATTPASKVEEEQVGRAVPRNRRKLKRVIEDDEEDVCQETENGASANDFTMDELLNIAQKNLEKETPTSANALNNASEVDAQPAKKKTRLGTALGACNKWRDERADEGGHMLGSRVDNVGTPRTGADGNDANSAAETDESSAQYESKAISDDTLTNEMYGLMFAFEVPREKERSEARVVREPSPVRQIETAPVQVVSEAPRPPPQHVAPRAPEPMPLGSKPKKKSSLKEQMMRMGL